MGGLVAGPRKNLGHCGKNIAYFLIQKPGYGSPDFLTTYGLISPLPVIPTVEEGRPPTVSARVMRKKTTLSTWAVESDCVLK